MFSSRTNWELSHNRLTEILENKRKNSSKIIDLTESNPTHCDFQYPEKEILNFLYKKENLFYEPFPKGILTARESVAKYYSGYGISAEVENIFLTASTSEAYSFLFRLLCEPNEEILVPKPGYPLFEFLADINDVTIKNYSLIYHSGWNIDFDSVKKNISSKTKAIVVVNPNNPTGSFIHKDEFAELIKICKENEIAIISDEVFSEYVFNYNPNQVKFLAETNEILVFSLNGISKMAGLPQMKLGWIYANGPDELLKTAVSKLEIIADTYLSVNTPVQNALPEILQIHKKISKQILSRIIENRSYLLNKLCNTACNCLDSEGGWYAIVRIPKTKTDEKWAIEILENENVFLHPGYFFNFDSDDNLVISLISQKEIFKEGIDKALEYIK